MKKSFLLWIAAVLLCRTAQSQDSPNLSGLNELVSATVQKLNMAGASVLVTRGDQVLLKKGYGFADLSHRVPTTPETTYFLVGPGGFILSACILQLIETGKIGLDDPLSRHLPDFPLQGRPVTIRHLMTSTSGIMDYHYLGDPLESTYRTPKASDEVVALFADRPFTSSEPGSRWDWSISNFALLVEVLEKVSGASYRDYLQEHIIGPLGLKQTVYLEEKQLIMNFANGYNKQGEDIFPAHQSLLTYDPSLRVSSSTNDLLMIWNAIRSKKLISGKSFEMMTTPEGVAKKISEADPTLQFGFILRIRKMATHTVMGLHGALPGYSSYCYYFPDDDISIVVLANTSNQFANDIGEAIARKIFGQPQAPDRVSTKLQLEDKAVSPEEQNMLKGTYVLSLAPDPARHRSYDYYRRTMRVLVEQGRLKTQALGDLPQPLLKQQDGTYAVYSSPAQRWSFDTSSGKAQQSP